MNSQNLKKKILIVEDEPAIADTLVYALKTENFDVALSSLAKDAEDYLSMHVVDLVILDVGLPDKNGFDLCKQIRQSISDYKDVPILFLTARKEEVDRIIGLEIGGDDYVTKPFSPRELTARVKAILKRINPVLPDDNAGKKNIGHFTMDVVKGQITYFKEPLVLTRYEYLILCALLSNPERIFSRAQLMDKVWDEPGASYDRVVDTHIKSLRAKLYKVSDTLDPIKTHRGMGYSLSYK